MVKVLLVVVASVYFMVMTSSAIAQIPHVFQAGQSAKASEVNDNFDFVNRSNYVLKSNGTVVGDVVSINYDKVGVINDKGFSFVVTKSGYIYAVMDMKRHYSEKECKGSVYVQKPLFNMAFSGLSCGSDMYCVWYTTTAQEELQVTYNSTADNTYGCTDMASPAQASLVAPYINDTSVTGIPTTSSSTPTYAMPLTVEKR